MLRILGNPKRLCDGLTRRDLLRVGTLGGLGLAAGGPTATATATGGGRGDSFGRAKACILLFLYGSPSQIETFDPKPDAPEGIRGDLGRAIATSVPGLSIANGLPRLAKVVDRAAIVRSLTHPYPIHGVAYALTGIPRIDVPLELNPHDPGHWPFIGSVVDYADRAGGRGRAADVPRNLLLPWAFSSRRVGEVPRAGPYAGFLGAAYDPIAVEFDGRATVRAKKTLQEKTWDDVEPYRGITAESRFRPASVGEEVGALTFDRMDRRRSLLAQFEAARRDADRGAARSGIDRHRALAYSLLASEPLRNAFDLGREPMATREAYGLTLFGQAALTARRLVEAGGRFVSVFWDEYGLAGTGWDTHWDHFARMKDELLPGLDRTLSALLSDLDDRGMLDETLVLCLSEHGRTPKIDGSKGGGRDHWSRCYSALLAGGGIARGRVVGKSDRIASDPAERPLSPKDILATAYHLLGIAPDTPLIDRQGRPMAMIPEGQVIPELLA